MAIQQPIGSDSLNSPSHSKLHRVIAADNTAPDESLAVSADGAIKQKQIASSTTPASGENKLYFKSDDKLYKKDSAGAEVEVGAGSGDMLASVYDPTNITGDVFDMDNMIEGTNKILTSSERTILSNTSNTNTGDQDLTTYQLKPSEGAFIDGDKTKLSGIEALADVTDTANVTTAGALMDSEVTNLAQVKAFDTTDYAPSLGADDNYVTDAEKSALHGVNDANSSSATSAQGDTADAALPKAGGTMTGDILGAVSYGATGTRVTKVWAENIESTNAPTVGGVVVPTISSTNTLTNKRITKRVKTFTSDATPDIDSDDYDAVTITAQEVEITDVNVTGTPTNFQPLMFRIKDDGTEREIAWGSDFEAGGVALPDTTVAGKTLLVGFIWDSVDNKWAAEASSSRA